MTADLERAKEMILELTKELMAASARSPDHMTVLQLQAVTAERDALLAAEPTEAEVEAAAEAMHGWDTLNRPWVSVTPVVKNMWLDAARVGLRAAAEARR